MKKIKNAFVWLLLAELAAVICFPILMALTGGFSAQWELEQNLAPVLGEAAVISADSGLSGFAGWSLLPQAPTLVFLVAVLIDSPEFFVMFWNSVKIAVLVLAGELLFGIPASWGLARFSFPGRRAISALYLVLMLMPFQVLMLPQYLVLNRLNLLDTHAAVILPLVFSTFPVFLMERFFRAVPEAIVDAARIDGAGHLQIFLLVGLPLGAPGIMSTVILTFLEAWNLIEQPMTFLKTKGKWPLSLFLPEISLKDAGLGFAAALLMLIPALLVFWSGQEYLEQGIAAAAVKE